MSTEEPNPFAFDATDAVAPIRQVAENAIARHARRGSIVLFFVGGLQLVFMFLFGMMLVALIAERIRLNQEEIGIHPLVFFSFALGVILGIVFLGLGFWSRRDPLLAPII